MLQDDRPSWPAYDVQAWPIEDLIPAARNSRIHADAQVEKIAASIREFGWTIPVLVDENGELIAGHGRVLAAKLLGIDEVPVMVARGWTEAQKRAYRIADNKLTDESKFDLDMLQLEIGDLILAGFDMPVIGFSDKELAELLKTAPLAGEAPEPGDPTNAKEEWRGMPEFEMQDKQPFRSFHLHFHDQQGIDDFAKLTGQTVTEKTKYVWFPDVRIETYADKRYSAK